MMFVLGLLCQRTIEEELAEVGTLQAMIFVHYFLDQHLVLEV